jgi:HK97 family phage prohead protease
MRTGRPTNQVEHRLVAIAPTTPVAQPDANLSEGEFLAKAVVYSVRDSYGTDFAPGVFNDSLTTGPLPPVLWSHNSQESPTNVLGQIVDWSDSLSALLVVGQLDQANPHYDLVRGQLQSKTIVGVSVGFVREADAPSIVNDGGFTILRATLCELSLVVEPSVPGAMVMSVRAAQRRKRARTPMELADDALREVRDR